MTDSSLTHLIAVIDRSVSMATIREDMEGGFNKLVADQRALPGTCKLTLVRFDTEYETVYTDRDLSNVPPLVIEPRGMTALLDAIGRTIVHTGEKLAALPEDQRPGLVVFAIVTDGMENSSIEYRLPQIHEMITRQREQYQWMFVFLGANQDAIATGAALGLRRGQTVTYAPTHAGTQSAYASTSGLIGATRMKVNSGTPAGQAVTDYTDEDRTNAVQDDK